MGLWGSIGDAFSSAVSSLGGGDVLDKLNNWIDDKTGIDFLGDAAAFTGAVITGQWDEAVQAGLDGLEDIARGVGWEEAGDWLEAGAKVVDSVSDLYHGRYAEGLHGFAGLAREAGWDTFGGILDFGAGAIANGTLDSAAELFDKIKSDGFGSLFEDTSLLQQVLQQSNLKQLIAEHLNADQRNVLLLIADHVNTGQLARAGGQALRA